MASVPIFAPDGTLGDIPAERLAEAVKAGAKPGVHITAPDGSPGVIPADRTQDAIKAGAKLVPIQEQPAKDFWSEAGSALWNGLKSIPGAVYHAATDPIAEEGLTREQFLAKRHAEAATEQAAASSPERMAHGALYRNVGVPLAETVGADVKTMEQGAAEGNPGKVLGTAAVVPTAMAASAGIVKGAGAAVDAIPSTTRAGGVLQNIKQVAGSVPVDTAKFGDSALELWTQSERGASLPTAVRKLLRRITDPDAPAMTYAEAKDFQSNISSLSANEKMNLKPNQVRLLGQLNQDMKASLADAADTIGKGEQFQQAMKEYHQAMQLRGFSEKAISAGWKMALAGLGLHEAGKVVGMIQR